MQQFDHPHIIHLVGICSETLPVWIVMELAKHGEVRTTAYQYTLSFNLCEVIVILQSTNEIEIHIIFSH